jgi:heat shock protein HslJ
MSDMDDNAERRLRTAFENLRDDAAGLETGAALASVHSGRSGGSGWLRPGVMIGAAVAALLVVFAVVALRDDDTTTTAADDDSSTDDGVDGPTSPPVDALAGTSWTLTRATVPDGIVELDEEWPVTISFEGGTAGGRAPCNSYGGTYELTDGSIAFGSLSSTEMACGEPAMTIESAYLAALPVVDSVTVSGDVLTLTAPGIELVYERNEPLPEAELIGQLWTLDTLVRGETATSVAGDPATLVLSQDGSMEAGTGCRSLTGEYVITGNSVVVTSLSADGDCPGDLRAQDDQVISVLSGGFTAVVDGNRLVVTASGGEGLGYAALDEDEAQTTPPPADDRDEPIGVDELLETRPSGPLRVSGHAVRTGGGWVICEDLAPAPSHQCAGRWVVVTNLDRTLGINDSPEGSDEAAAALARADDRFELQAGLVFTPSPQVWDLELLDDGRSADPAHPSDADATESELALRDAFAAAANASPIDVASLSITSDIELGLGVELVASRAPSELSDPGSWRLDADGFRARTGPFSAMELIGTATDLELSVGPHDHCASPPTAIAPELRDLRHVSFAPAEATSCLEWFTVDVFLDDGVVVAITLDLWEP